MFGKTLYIIPSAIKRRMAGQDCSTLFTKTMVKFLGSVETLVQLTVFWPSLEKPVALVGAVTWRAKAEVARARTAAKVRMAK